MNMLIYFILFAAVFIAGASVLLARLKPRHLKLLLSFSGAYLFALAILHLVPEVYAGDPHAGLFILVGFFIQVVLETYSEGIEHGHIHIHKGAVGAFPVGLMAGLCLHSFLEGMPLVKAGAASLPLTGGIVLHHIPVAMALVGMLLDSGLKRGSTVFWLALFCLMAPAGAFFSHWLGAVTSHDLSQYYNRMMAVVIGIFLHISTTILFESDSEHRFSLYKLGTMVLGAGLALCM